MTDKTDEELITEADLYAVMSDAKAHLICLLADRLAAALEREKDLKRLMRYLCQISFVPRGKTLITADVEAIEKIVGEK